MASSGGNIKSDTHPTLIKWILILAIFLLGFIFVLTGKLYATQGSILALILDLLGGFLVIAVPLEILRELFFEKDNIASFVTQVEGLFDRKIDLQIRARQFGLIRIEESLLFDKVFDSLKPGDTLWWLDTFSPGHKGWIDHVEAAIRHGASVNMLILDPESPLCAMRAEEIGGYYKPERFRNELETFIADFKECQKTVNEENSKGARLTISLYRDLLGVPCYIVVRKNQPILAYSSMYLTKPTGVDFPHFCWNQGPMCDILYSYVMGKYNRNPHL